MIEGIETEAGQALAIALMAHATMLDEYSRQPDHPNVSAWLRSGAIDEIRKVEQELRDRHAMDLWEQSMGEDL